MKKERGEVCLKMGVTRFSEGLYWWVNTVMLMLGFYILAIPMHYVFDEYMATEFPSISWARYADDAIAHCVSLKQAESLLAMLNKQFAKYGLELHPEKTKIVYCKDGNRKGDHEHTSFDFLGYTFRARKAVDKHGRFFTNFLPAISGKATNSIREEVRNWRLQLKSDKSLQDIASMYNSKIRGWLNHYAHFYRSELYRVLRYIDDCLIKWVQRKYKKLQSKQKAAHWLRDVAKREPMMFAHWKSWNT